MGEIAKLWELAISAGPFASMLLLYLYLDERKERRKKDEELRGVLDRSIAVINDVQHTLDAWLSVLDNSRRPR